MAELPSLDSVLILNGEQVLLKLPQFKLVLCLKCKPASAKTPNQEAIKRHLRHVHKNFAQGSWPSQLQTFLNDPQNEDWPVADNCAPPPDILVSELFELGPPRSGFACLRCSFRHLEELKMAKHCKIEFPALASVALTFISDDTHKAYRSCYLQRCTAKSPCFEVDLVGSAHRPDLFLSSMPPGAPPTTSAHDPTRTDDPSEPESFLQAVEQLNSGLRAWKEEEKRTCVGGITHSADENPLLRHTRRHTVFEAYSLFKVKALAALPKANSGDMEGLALCESLNRIWKTGFDIWTKGVHLDGEQAEPLTLAQHPFQRAMRSPFASAEFDSHHKDRSFMTEAPARANACTVMKHFVLSQLRFMLDPGKLFSEFPFYCAPV